MFLKRRIGLVLKLGVSAVLIGMVYRNIGTGVFARFEGQSGAWVFAASLVTLSQILLGAVRWRFVLDGLKIRVPAEILLKITFISNFCNSWLLGIVGGDIARAMLLPAETRGRAVVIHSVLFDRAVTLAGLGLVIVPAAVFDLSPRARGLPLFLSFAVAMLPLAGLCCVTPLARAANRWRLPLSRYLSEVAESWTLLCHSPSRLAGALAFAASGVVGISVTAWCLAHAQHLDASLPDFLMLMAPVVLVSSLPISVGGWGVRENAMVVALAPAGIAAAPALVISVQMGLLAALMSLPGGAVWLLQILARQRLAAATQ